MGYRKTEHQNAIVKMVREKRMILQMDLASLMNKKDIKGSVERLVEQGKFKRQKIKNRGKVGNLTDVWLIYANDVKQEDILEFEKQMISKPFVSPLVKNHCYKSPERPIEQELKTEKKQSTEQTAKQIIAYFEPHNEINNVVEMKQYIKVNNQDVRLREYQGERVVTLQEIAKLHEVNNRTIKENFNNNKQYLKLGEDYFILTKIDYENFVNEKLGREYNATKEIILFTEQGYLLIVKSLTGEKAWEVQRQLVKCYFKIQELKEKQENNLPITKQDLNSIDSFDFFKNVALGMTNLNDRVKSLESTIEGIKKAISS